MFLMLGWSHEVFANQIGDFGATTPVTPQTQCDGEGHFQSAINEAYANHFLSPGAGEVKERLKHAVDCLNRDEENSDYANLIENFVVTYSENSCWPEEIQVTNRSIFSCENLSESNSNQSSSSGDLLPVVVGILGELITGAVQNQNSPNPQPVPQASPAPTVAGSQSNTDQLLAQWGWERVECNPNLVLVFGLDDGVVCVDPMLPELPAGQYNYDASTNQLIQIQAGQADSQRVDNSSSPTIVPVDE